LKTNKRILLVNCVFPPEPIVSAEIGYDLAKNLSDIGKEVTVITPIPTRPYGFKFSNKSVKNNFRHVFLNSYTNANGGMLGRLIESISFGYSSYKFIRDSNGLFDKVYMNTWPIFGQLGVALACIKTRTPYILHIQDIYPESLINKLRNPIKFFINAFLLPIDKFILRRALSIIVISDKMKDYLVATRKLNIDKIQKVYNWQNEKDYDKVSFSECVSDKLTFMYLGNIGPVANIPTLIKLFSQSNVDSRLIIAGSGSDRRKCEELVIDLNCTSIEFADVPFGEVPRFQSKADILVLSTIINGAKSSVPSKLPAYMLSKKPIFAIVDKDTETSDIIKTSNCGWVVAPNDEDKIGEIFINLAKEKKQKLLTLGLNGYNFAINNFSRKVNLSRLTDIIISSNEN
jgi:glycosyltransferase involved in cell wall biosynthesis